MLQSVRKSSLPLGEYASLVEVVMAHARERGDDTAFIALEDGEEEGERITFGTLDAQARKIGHWLEQRGLTGERVLLLYPSGKLEFIQAFLGCVYAGAVAVPCHWVRKSRGTDRLAVLCADAQPRLVLTDVESRPFVEPQVAEVLGRGVLHCLTEETLSAGDSRWDPPKARRESLALLQYTSGSTRLPQGVMVTQGNVLANVAGIQEVFGLTPASTVVSWLPFFHDMGLIGGVLSPLLVGATSCVMPPNAFVQRPLRWLRAITRYGATHSGGPNFGYDACVRSVRSEDLTGLDLSRWEVAWNGAEPIRHRTLEDFTRRFGPCGFRRDAHFPCYGLAEATLMVTGARAGQGARAFSVRSSSLRAQRFEPCTAEGDDYQFLVSSGHVFRDEVVRIVNADGQRVCRPGEVGEVWVSGPSVAKGYWNNPEATSATFAARLAELGPAPFLRTGDLGVLHDGELLITGRLKDLIIIRGVNLHPQDVEATVEEACDDLQSHAVVAFATEAETAEDLTLVCEVKRTRLRTVDRDELFRRVRASVASEHQVAVGRIVLVKPLDVPLTSSGKPQRRKCAELLASGGFSILTEWRRTGVSFQAVETLSRPRTRAELRDALASALSGLLALPRQELIRNRPFSALGMDSVQAVEVSASLGGAFERRLPATLLFDHPDLNVLTEFIAGTILDLPIEPSRTLEPGVPAGVASRVAETRIAVVGLACRFPGARDFDAFCDLLQQGRDAIREVPTDRWDPRAIDGLNGATCLRGGFLEDIDQFDASFFGISPREAASIDPQHRLLLEVSWEALEDAGLMSDRLGASRSGVYMGLSTHDYGQLLCKRRAEEADAYLGVGASSSAGVGRISYALGFQGPSVAVDTACSSSLTAVNLACQALDRGECDLALAGGVNALLDPTLHVALLRAKMLAPDGRCKTFDASADGYGRSEGCGVVVLKRLRDAERDGDRVLAVILGGAVNHNGTSGGFTVPSGNVQERLLADALQQANSAPAEMAYLECHGTGTSLGDPIEVAAAAKVLGEGRASDRPLLLGSVKSNLGHLEAAAGIAGLLKVIAAFRQDQIPRHLHVARPNPHIPWHELPVRIATEPTAWPAGRRLAGVSSFGFTGTNAHVVVEAPDSPSPARDERESSPRVLVLSARTEAALHAQARNLATWLSERPETPLAGVCHTLGIGRKHFEYRAAIVATTVAEALAGCSALATSAVHPDVFVGRSVEPPRVAWLFPGTCEGALGMAGTLYDRFAVFRQSIDRLVGMIAAHTGTETASILDFPRSDLGLFSLEISLAELWRSFGLEPDLVFGGGMGALAACYVAGGLSLEDAVRLAICRTEQTPDVALLPLRRPMLLLHAAGTGDWMNAGEKPEPMLDVFLSREPADWSRLTPIVARRRCDVLLPIGADTGDLASLIGHWPSDAIRPVMLDCLCAEMGAIGTPDAFTPHASGRKNNSPAWEGGVGSQRSSPPDPVVLEPSNAAERFGAKRPPSDGHSPPPQPPLPKGGSYLELPPTGARGDIRFANHFAQLYSLGCRFDFAAWDRDESPRRLALPTYPFQRTRHWFEHRKSPTRPDNEVTRLDLASGETIIQRTVSARSLCFLRDHHIYGTMIVPGAHFLTLALDEFRASFQLVDIGLQEPILVPEGDERTLEFLIRPVDSMGERTFRFATRSASNTSATAWSIHGQGRVRMREEAHESLPGRFALESWISHRSARKGSELYADLNALGLQLGPAFRLIQTIWSGDREALAELIVPGHNQTNDCGAIIPTPVLDACCQVIAALEQDSPERSLFLPTHYERFAVFGPIPARFYCHARVRPEGSGRDVLVTDLTLLDPDGEVFGCVLGFQVRRAPRAALLRNLRGSDDRAAGTALAEAETAASLREALATSEDRHAVLVRVLQTEVARVLELSGPDDVPGDQPMADLGVDSLMASEFRDVVEKRLGQSVHVTTFFDHPTLDGLARHLLDHVITSLPSRNGVSPKPAPEPRPAPRRTRSNDEPIAVIGLACRFAGQAGDLGGFWKLLEAGGSVVGTCPPGRWDGDDVFPAEMVEESEGGPCGAFLDDVGRFDAGFFGLSDEEAERIDPQQRLLMEVAWSALEHAGIVPAQLVDSATGVFIGIGPNEYYRRAGSGVDAFLAMGNDNSAAPARLSHHLGLTGPSLAINTASSSALVAVHQACAALRRGECNLALVGAVYLLVSPLQFQAHDKIGVLSRRGVCRSFDRDADGMVLGEGGGVLVLKPLREAEADGDAIWAVIPGTAVNHNGQNSPMLGAPSVIAQERLIRQALNEADLTPDDLSYVEAQGSGTPVGDLIELRALENVFGQTPRSGPPLLVGSAHSNIGHTAWAGGIAGVIKTILQMHHGRVVPTANFRGTNERMARRMRALEIAAELQPWIPGGTPRRAGVSSFGVSGINGHVLLEEGPQTWNSAASAPFAPYHVFSLSARSSHALKRLARAYIGLLKDESIALDTICRRLLRDRTHFQHRLTAVVGTAEELTNALEAYVRGEPSPRLVASEAQPLARVAFLFDGLVPPFPRMGRELFETQPVFAAAVRECDEILGDELPVRLLSVLYPERGRSRLQHEPAFAELLLFTLGHALAEMWRSWGVEPDVVVGHDAGVFAAARVAGVLSLADALRLVAAHGRFRQAHLVNAPSRADRMAQAAREFEILLHDVVLNPPRIRVVSTASQGPGKEIDSVLHWTETLAQPSTFGLDGALRGLAEERIALMLDFGAGASPTPEGSYPTIPRQSVLREHEHSWQTVLRAAAEMHTRGVTIDWKALVPPAGPVRLTLPSYPFEGRRLWLERDGSDRSSRASRLEAQLQ